MTQFSLGVTLVTPTPESDMYWAESLLPTVLSLVEAIGPEESQNYYGVSCSRQAAKLAKGPFTYRLLNRGSCIQNTWCADSAQRLGPLELPSGPRMPSHPQAEQLSEMAHGHQTTIATNSLQCFTLTD